MRFLPLTRQVELDYANPEKIIVAFHGTQFYRAGNNNFYLIRNGIYERIDLSKRSFTIAYQNEPWFHNVKNNDIVFSQPFELWVKEGSGYNSSGWKFLSYKGLTLDQIIASPTPTINLTPTPTPTKTSTPTPSPTLQFPTCSPAASAGSMLFDGNSYLELNSGSVWNVGYNDFTFEFFMKPDNLSGNQLLFFSGGPSDTWGHLSAQFVNNKLYFGMKNTVVARGDLIDSSSNWSHIAFAHTNHTMSLFQNGLYLNEYTLDTQYYVTASEHTMNIGGASGRANFHGEITDFHFVSGTGLYGTASSYSRGDLAFVPPNAPLTAVANSKILLNVDYNCDLGWNSVYGINLSSINHGVQYSAIYPSLSATPTQTPTPTPTVTPTSTPTPTVTPTITETPSSTPTPTVTPTITLTPTISVTPTSTVTPTISVTPSYTPTLTPSSTPAPQPVYLSLLTDGTSNSVAYIPYNSAYASLGDFTVEFWFKRNGWGGDNARIIDHNYQTGFIVDRSGGGNNIGFYVNGSNISSATNIADQTWYHIACVRTGSAGYIYINGLYDNTGGINGSALSSTDDIGIGQNKSTSPGNERQPMTITDIRLWNTARTGDQILSNYIGHLVGNESGLIGNWQFVSGSSVLSDSTSTSNSIITGSAAFLTSSLPSGFPSGVSDNMEAYPTGSITTLNSGSGLYSGSWVGSGTITLYTSSFAADDFEAYSTGSVSTFNSGGYYWAASGTINAYLNSSVSDDMELYPTGSITTFDSGSAYAASWYTGTII